MWQLLLASLIWSFSYSLNKHALTGTNPFVVSCIFCAISVVLFSPAFSRRGLSLSLFVKLVLLGALEFGLMYVFFQMSFLFLGAYEVALLLITTPIYVTFIDGILNKTKLAIPCFLATICILLSFLVLYSGQYSFNKYGVLLLQCSNLSFAYGQVLVKKFFQNHTNITFKQSMSILYLGGLCVCCILALIVRCEHSPLTWNAFGWAMFLGITCCGICHYLWDTGIMLVKTPVVAVMNNLQIPLSILVSVLFFHETIELYKIVTCAVMMLFICLVYFFFKKNNV